MDTGAAKILIIDDEADLRENLKYVFEMKGYTVELAEDGLQGLEKLLTFHPDLIVLDLNMPNMGGIEFYQKICEGDIPKYPVFVLTARANMEQFFKEFNVDGFMAKPFEIPDLIKEAEAVLDKHSAKTSSSAREELHCRNIFIVENDVSFAAELGGALLMKGYTVNLANTGADGIERISRNVPDVACVKMNLTDISGEMVIAKLKRMAKTSYVKYILYAYGMGEREIVTDIIQHKAGIDKFVIAQTSKDLVEAVSSL
jgi:DNA-binding response OmpR family regulator